MKVTIKPKKFTFVIFIPVILIKWKFLYKVIAKSNKENSQYILSLYPHGEEIYKEIKRIKKRFKKLVLIDAKSHDGQRIKIVL